MLRVVVWPLSCDNLGEYGVQVEGVIRNVGPKSVGEIRAYGAREIKTMIEKFVIAVRVKGFIILALCRR